MYVLEEELAPRVLEEAQNKAARAHMAEAAVSIGLRGDAIQTLTIKANQGECLRIALRNSMNEGEPASAYIHGSDAYVASTSGPTIATVSPDAMAATGETVA